MAILFCVRHGETDWNREERWQGQDDQPLNAVGRAQAEAAARGLASDRFAAIYCSDLRRARDTALPLASVLELRPEPTVGLREIDTGSWTGLTRADVRERHPQAAARHAAGGDGWQGGETYRALFERVVATAEAIAGRHERSARVAVFSHGGPIRALVAHAAGAGWESSRVHVAPALHCAVTVLDVPGNRERWRLLAFNHPLAEGGARVPSADLPL
jgi:probable phosphoglycerate mutase